MDWRYFYGGCPFYVPAEPLVGRNTIMGTCVPSVGRLGAKVALLRGSCSCWCFQQ